MGATKCDLSDIHCLSVDFCVGDSTSRETEWWEMERKPTVSSIHEKHSKTHSLSVLRKRRVSINTMTLCALHSKLTPTCREIFHLCTVITNSTPPLPCIKWAWPQNPSRKSRQYYKYAPAWAQYGERSREGCCHRYGLALGPVPHRGLLQDGEVCRPRWMQHVHLARHPVAPQHQKTIPQTGISVIMVDLVYNIGLSKYLQMIPSEI